MDIDLLSRIVKELITDHDKVGLPGLGTFVAEVVPASFSDKGYTINPPYRRLSFHPDNTEADLLVKFYADSNHVPLEASRVYITEFLSELKQVLIQRKTVIFPGLGRLRATKENNFFFVPDEDLDIYPDGFGLQPVSMKYIQGVADPVDIKLSYSDAMRGFEDRHRAAEPELPAEMGQPSEPGLPVAGEQSAAGEPQLETLSPDQAEPGQPVESAQPITEAQHQPEAEERLQREEQPGTEPVQPSEPGQSSEPGQLSEPAQPITEAQPQPEAEERLQREEQPDTEHGQPAEPMPQAEPVKPAEPIQPAASQVQPVAEGQPSEQEQPTEPDQAEQEQPSEDPSERQCGAAPAEQLQGEERDAAPAELPGGERGAAPAEQLQGEERDAAPAEQLHGAESDTALVKLPGEERDAAPAELPGEESGDVRRRCRWWIAPVVVLSLAVVALGVFVILAHAAPDFIDSILYTPEELKILNY